MTLLVLDAPGLVTVQDRGRTRPGAPGRAAGGRAGPSGGRARQPAGRQRGRRRRARGDARRTDGVEHDGQVGRGDRRRLPGARSTASRPGTAARSGCRPGPSCAWARPATGVRSYLAVAGGIAVEPVLGSRSTDTLAWVGPPRVADGAGAGGRGAQLVGPPRTTPRDHRPPVRLRVDPGPRADWLAPDALDRLCRTAYTVTTESNRIGLRLDGPPIASGPRRRAGQRGDGARSGPGATGRAPRGLPGRPPADRRLPGAGRGPGRGPLAVRAAAAGR